VGGFEGCYTARVRIWPALLLLAVETLAAGGITADPASARPGVKLQNPPAEPEAARPSFAEFLTGVRTEALARGIRPDIVDAALSDIEEPLPIVIERDRAQAETVFSLEKYLSRLLTVKLITHGREALAGHKMLLEEVSARYGVPPGVVVAIWGVESNFGSFSGVRPTVAALATLAWDPRRSEFFRGELFAALEILNHGDIDAARMRGSWAGAMGQVQFMPSSYLKFAEDFDGDGRRDIWSSPPDVLASIANYLQAHGWAAGPGWGREVHLAEEAAGRIAAHVARRAGTCRATRDMTVALPIKEWKRLGVRLPHGGALPDGDPDASLVSGATRYFLVSRNYDALLEYNCSHSYAISVGLLADQITSPRASTSDAGSRKAKSRRHPAEHPEKSQ
jgi:membrane-bound lytic murein transglycosylase B